MPDRSFGGAVVLRVSRRGLLARAGRLLLATAGGGAVAAAVRAQAAEAYHFCGHVYTTGSCPHPTGLPRVDEHGMPLRVLVGGVSIDNKGWLYAWVAYVPSPDDVPELTVWPVAQVGVPFSAVLSATSEVELDRKSVV